MRVFLVEEAKNKHTGKKCSLHFGHVHGITVEKKSKKLYLFSVSFRIFSSVCEKTKKKKNKLYIGKDKIMLDTFKSISLFCL